jgi:transforming growth factor-beta-induced protein
MIRKYHRTAAIAVSAALATTACAESRAVTPEPGNIVQVAQGAGTFTTLLAAAEAAGLVATLSGEGPFTVFAPTDAAFANLPAGAVDALLADTELLKRVLTYHVVAGSLNAQQVLGRSELATVNGAALAVRMEGGVAYVGNARVTQTDIQASNGFIHIIDTVLLPEAVLDIPATAAAAGTFGTLLAAVRAAGLLEALQGDGPFTVFAPTDDAFAKLPAGTVDALLADPARLAGILTYHVVPGSVRAADVVNLTAAETLNGASVTISAANGVVRINHATVTAVDIDATNGVIHVIDTVLIPAGG